jgi:hypothetical protein
MQTASLKPIAFVVMPYGIRTTGVDKAPAQVDFNALYSRALARALQDLGYEPVRADADSGGLIIREMIQRLAQASVIVAEVSLPNPNVYYEIGVRHAARRDGCVLLAADWSQQSFDLAQMPHVRYPLDDGKFESAVVKNLRALFREKINPLVSGESPVFQAIEGYPGSPEPGNTDALRSSALHTWAAQLARFQSVARRVHELPASERESAVRRLMKEHSPGAEVQEVALDLLFLIRDNLGWEETLRFISDLSPRIRELPTVREQYAIGVSKLGDPYEAIALLEALIATDGPTSERYGLLGARYKDLYRRYAGDSPRQARHYLDEAIRYYELGMQVDLNDFYPAFNLLQHLELRGREEDLRRARYVAIVADEACMRAAAHGNRDEWLDSTRLYLYFYLGDVESAAQLVDNPGFRYAPEWSDWRGSVMRSSVKEGLKGQSDPEIARKLKEVYDRLEKVIMAKFSHFKKP